jgi:hypothetical protein
MKRTNRVAVSFARFNKDQLNCFAILVLLCLRNNPLFSKPTVSLADLGALQVAYQDAMSAAALGGPKDSAAFREARGALVRALRRWRTDLAETGRLSEYAGDCAGRPHAGRGVCDAGSCHWRLDALQRLEQPHFLHGHLGGTSTTYMQSPERARM